MTSIPFSSVILGERYRKTYSRISELADAITQVGLIQPLVLDPNLNLRAGGRRYHALAFLETTELFHATTCVPGRPGYILMGEASPFTGLLVELRENLDREDMPWQEAMKLIVDAFQLARTEAVMDGRWLTESAFGTMLNVPRMDIESALQIYDDVAACPEDYAECESLRHAYKKLLSKNLSFVSKLASEKSLRTVPLLGDVASPAAVSIVREQQGPAVPPQDAEERPAPEVIPISQQFLLTNGLDFMEKAPPGFCHHIVCDPDYALDVDTLNSNATDAGRGVVQSSVEDSLADLRRLITLAFRCLPDRGFFIFWYDLDHHNLLQKWCKDVGFYVQRWPLTWRKLDYRSNGAPAHNFCKNEEWAMVCRKEGTTLIRAQMSSVYDAIVGPVVRDFGHPFAKPLPLWRWIYSAIAAKGEVVFDPFVGSGSSAVAAMQEGLRPTGCEINPSHYANLVLNLQVAYHKLLGSNITFT